MHACRENFIVELAKHGMTKRDIVSNINFFMNVRSCPTASSQSSMVRQTRRLRRAAGRDGRALRHLKLPQVNILQRIQPHSRARTDLGRIGGG